MTAHIGFADLPPCTDAGDECVRCGAVLDDCDCDAWPRQIAVEVGDRSYLLEQHRGEAPVVHRLDRGRWSAQLGCLWRGTVAADPRRYLDDEDYAAAVRQAEADAAALYDAATTAGWS